MSRLGRYVNAILTGDKENLPAPRSERERELYEAAMKEKETGGVKIWDELEGKPFGEVEVYGDTLTWDGNTEGLISVKYESNYVNWKFYKVADSVPSIADFSNGWTQITTFVDGGMGHDSTSSAENIGEFDHGVILLNNSVLFIPESAVNKEILISSDDNPMIFPEKGTYLFYSYDEPFSWVSSLTINNYAGFPTKAIQPLDSKYLNEALQFGGKRRYHNIITRTKCNCSWL